MGNVLITGATGFVGSRLAQALLPTLDCHVVSMVRDRTRDAVGHSIVHGDVTDQAFSRRVLADYEIGTIYHLAAQSIVSVCAEDPLAALEVAVMGTARLLQAVRDVGRPCRVVVMTSDKVYGSAPAPYTESTPLDARHAYEVSKACQDLVARMFAANYGLDVQVIRAVNIYGPGDPNESRIVPRTILRCLSGEPPILHSGAAAMRRQYVYIDDMVEALRFIARWGVSGEAYCVGSLDEPLSVLDVMASICQATGTPWKAPEVQQRDVRFCEIAQQAVDGSKLKRIGWEPGVKFADGIRETVNWYKER